MTIETVFQKGDVVEATINAQGLTQGARYFVVGKSAIESVFGTFVVYLLAQAITDAPIAVTNGHVVLKHAEAAPATAMAPAGVTPAGAAVAAFSMRRDLARAAKPARATKPGRKARAERKERVTKTDEETRAKFRLYTAKSRAKKAIAAGAPAEQALDILTHGGWTPAAAKEALADLTGKAKPAAPAKAEHAAKPAAKPAEKPARRSLRRGARGATDLLASDGGPAGAAPALPDPAPQPALKEPAVREQALAIIAEAEKKGEPAAEVKAEAPAKAAAKTAPVVDLTDEALAEKVAAMLAANPKLKSADVIRETRVSQKRAVAAVLVAKAKAAPSAPAPEPTAPAAEPVVEAEAKQPAPPANLDERRQRAEQARAKLAAMTAGKK